MALDTRSKAGREALAASVLSVITKASGPIAAVDIAQKTGATLLQVRSAIRRLGDKIVRAGQTRATTYALAPQDGA